MNYIIKPKDEDIAYMCISYREDFDKYTIEKLSELGELRLLDDVLTTEAMRDSMFFRKIQCKLSTLESFPSVTITWVSGNDNSDLFAENLATIVLQGAANAINRGIGNNFKNFTPCLDIVPCMRPKPGETVDLNGYDRRKRTEAILSTQ